MDPPDELAEGSNGARHRVADARATARILDRDRQARRSRWEPRMLHKVRRARGLTLVEVMVVIVIMGLISAGIAVGVMKRWDDARRSTTETNARALRQIAMGWRVAHDDVAMCPTAAMLVHDGSLDEASRTKDAWGTPFEIACEADRTIVRSFGPDRVKGGDDDIVIPFAS